MREVQARVAEEGKRTSTRQRRAHKSPSHRTRYHEHTQGRKEEKVESKTLAARLPTPRALTRRARTSPLLLILRKSSNKEVAQRTMPSARRMDKRGHTPRSQGKEEVYKLLARRQIANIRLRLHVLKVNTHAEPSIEKMESIDKQRRVQLARISM